MQIKNGTIIFEDNTSVVLSITQENKFMEFVKNQNGIKDRVKQSLKLKDAGFTGKEIIDIIGEIE